MHIKKERQLFVILIIAVFLVFLGSVVGGVIAFSLFRDGYSSSIEGPIRLKYSPSTTFSSEFQKILQPSLVKMVRYRILPPDGSILDEAFIYDKIISYGFLVSSDGWIVTSFSPSSSFIILTSDGESFLPEKIVKVKSLGLNFVKIKGSNFPVLSLGDEHSIVFGDDVFVVREKKVFKNSLAYFGYPDFLKKNDFVLSSEEPNKFLFLTDGLTDDFGSPVFSKRGEVIGVVNDKGLIIPISLIKIYLRSLWKNEEVIMPYLGVKYFDLSVLPVKVKNVGFKKGAYIFSKNELSDAIIKKSPAQRFGLLPGDIILSIMGDEINEDYNLAERILEFSPGDKIDLEILRGGEKIEVSVELGEK